MLLASVLLLPLFTPPFAQSGPPNDASDLLSDRRLVSTELWLVDRRPDGTELSDQLVLRGRFDERQRFYFQDIQEAGITLDIFGDLIARLHDGQLELEISAHRRFSRNDGSKEPQGPFSFGLATLRLQVKTSDVASLELPPPAATGPFKGHALSLRVRSRQIRGSDRAGGTPAVDVGRVVVQGYVRQPGEYLWRPNLTVQDLIALAGGLTSQAQGSPIVWITRKEDGKTVRAEAKPSDVLRAGDALIIRRRIF